MNILVTGANGQLGKSLAKIAPFYPDFNFTWTDVAELDITNNDAVHQIIQELKPHFLINCAAYTAVDKAEEEPDKALILNSKAPEFLTSAMEAIMGSMIHISTDYVFDGKGTIPYKEDHPCRPVSQYGRSKHLGEEKVLSKSKRSIVIRTAWLYSEFGHNFVKTMIKLGRERDKIRVVADQIGSPTWASDLANAILQMVRHPFPHTNSRIYHYANTGITTWHGLAKAVMELSSLDCEIEAITTKEYPTLAIRPTYSVLDTALIKDTFGLEIPQWEKSLAQCIGLIMQEDCA